jgi:hypothetical protein
MTDDPKPKITPEEMQRRREAVRQALACNRIEGIKHDPASDPIFEAWILGEIEAGDLVPRLKAHLGLSSSDRS